MTRSSDYPQISKEDFERFSKCHETTYGKQEYEPPRGRCSKCGEEILMDIIGLAYALYCKNYCFIDIKPMEIPEGMKITYDYYYGDKK